MSVQKSLHHVYIYIYIYIGVYAYIYRERVSVGERVDDKKESELLRKREGNEWVCSIR